MKRLFDSHLNQKKGQGISMRVVIVAALALICLVVLLFFFTTKLDFFGKQVSSCIDRGGECRSECLSGEMTILKTECNANEVSGDDKCCIPSGF